MHITFNQDKVDESMLVKFRRQHVSSWYRFRTGVVRVSILAHA